LYTGSLFAGSVELDLLWEDVSAAEAAHRDEAAFVPSSAAAWRLHAMRPRHDAGGWRGFTLGQVHGLMLKRGAWPAQCLHMHLQMHLAAGLPISMCDANMLTNSDKSKTASRTANLLQLSCQQPCKQEASRAQAPDHKRPHLRLRPARQSSGTATAFGGTARAGSANVDDQPDAGDDADSHHTFASMLTAVTSRHETSCKAKSIGESPPDAAFHS